jgi:hypothetical protein
MGGVEIIHYQIYYGYRTVFLWEGQLPYILNLLLVAHLAHQCHTIKSSGHVENDGKDLITQRTIGKLSFWFQNLDLTPVTNGRWAEDEGGCDQESPLGD